MDVDTARYLNTLCAHLVYGMRHLSSMRYGILVKSAVFQRLNKNITTVKIQATSDAIGRRKEFELLVDALMLLPKLRQLTLGAIYEAHKYVLPLLESIEDHLVYLKLYALTGNMSIHDLMRTCSNLVQLSLSNHQCKNDSLGNNSYKHHDQIQKPNKQPVLHYLTEIYLNILDEGMCNADMLIALLQSPNLNKITLRYLEAMSDDVMWNVLSSGGCTALSKVTEFTVYECPWITAEPLVHWLTKENCSLQFMMFTRCEKMDCHILRDAAEKYPRDLMIVENC